MCVCVVTIRRRSSKLGKAGFDELTKWPTFMPSFFLFFSQLPSKRSKSPTERTAHLPRVTFCAISTSSSCRHFGTLTVFPLSCGHIFHAFGGSHFTFTARLGHINSFIETCFFYQKNEANKKERSALTNSSVPTYEMGG